MSQLQKEMEEMEEEMRRFQELLESPRGEISSPEAKLGMRVEDLWDIQEPQLTPTEKLNACFESIPVSSFPQASPSQVVELNSDTSLADAVQILSEHKILSAPVVNVSAPADASWMDRYIGMVEFAGIVVWILHQSELTPNGSGGSVENQRKVVGVSRTISGNSIKVSPNGKISDIEILSPQSAAITSGKFFEALISSDFYKNTKVEDISGSFRWAPFLALQKSNSFLTMLLLLSKYKMKSIPLVDLGGGSICNIITQAGVIHMLAECAGLHWFEDWGTKSLSELGLPLMNPSQIIKVEEDEPVLQAFKLMRKTRVGGVPVVERGGMKAAGNISIRDVHYLLTTPEIYKDYRSITALDFLTEVRNRLGQGGDASPRWARTGMITCRRGSTIKDIILMLDMLKIHRIYLVDAEGCLDGVITLRDIISKLVHEPRGYFGDFFDGVLPLPENSRV